MVLENHRIRQHLRRARQLQSRVALAIGDFNDQLPARPKQLAGTPNQRANHIQAVSAAPQRRRGLVLPHVGSDLGPLVVGDIRRIGADDIKLTAAWAEHQRL